MGGRNGTQEKALFEGRPINTSSTRGVFKWPRASQKNSQPSRMPKTRKRQHGGKLKSSYGVVVLPKGTRLYHASINKLCALPQKPVLFMTLHPSEWYTDDSHISVIELQREVTLLFMVKMIHRMKVISSLNSYLENGASNLAKMDYEKIKCWLPFLKKEKLDGWFSSIENKTAVEFAVLNDPSILKIIECLPITFNWSNTTYNNTNELVPKNWGTTYKVTTAPIRFVLNSRYKPQIEEYEKQVEKEDPMGTAFSVLLKTARIEYFDAPLETIKWCGGLGR